MAWAGIGVDMLEISRMQRAMDRHPGFARRVFTSEECAYCDSCRRPAEHYALRFAAREAVLKALGTGFAEGIGLRDVSVGRDEAGRPVVRLAGRARQIADEQGVEEVLISLSRTHEVAVANAVAVTGAVRPAKNGRSDPELELRTSFKAARSIIDELERLQDGIMEAPEEEGPAPALGTGDGEDVREG